MQPAIETGAERRLLFSVAAPGLLAPGSRRFGHHDNRPLQSSRHRWLAGSVRLRASLALGVAETCRADRVRGPLHPDQALRLAGEHAVRSRALSTRSRACHCRVVVSLLIDPRVQARAARPRRPNPRRRTASVLSDVANSQRINQLQVNSEVVKGLDVPRQLLCVVLLHRQRRQDARAGRAAGRGSVPGAGVVGVLATIEYRTHFNAFDHLRVVMPFLAATAPDGPWDLT